MNWWLLVFSVSYVIGGVYFNMTTMAALAELHELKSIRGFFRVVLSTLFWPILTVQLFPALWLKLKMEIEGEP